MTAGTLELVELEQETREVPPIIHLICGICKVVRSAGSPIKALCGKEKDKWNDVNSADPLPECVVCFDVHSAAQGRCPTCRNRMFL